MRRNEASRCDASPAPPRWSGLRARASGCPPAHRREHCPQRRGAPVGRAGRATRPRTAAPQPVAAAPQSVDRASGATSRRTGVGRIAAPWPSRSESRSLDSPLATPFPPSSLGPRRLRRCAAELAGPHRHRLPPPWDSESEPGQRCLPASPGASPHGTPESRHVAPASTGHVSPASPARTPSLSRASRPRESARVRVGNPGRPPSQCGPRLWNPSPSRWPAVCVTRVAIRCDLSRAADRGPRLGRGPGSTWSAPGDPPRHGRERAWQYLLTGAPRARPSRILGRWCPKLGFRESLPPLQCGHRSRRVPQTFPGVWTERLTNARPRCSYLQG